VTVDTSAILAILLGEPDAEAIAQALVSEPKRLLAAVSALEAAIVMEFKKGAVGVRELDLLIHQSQIEVAGMNSDQVEIARNAYHRFGKGRHPASLNLGDCCSYALARYSGQRLLFKGNDFGQTDIPIVPY
jgi:ribonuclease VapC